MLPDLDTCIILFLSSTSGEKMRNWAMALFYIDMSFFRWFIVSCENILKKRFFEEVFRFVFLVWCVLFLILLIEMKRPSMINVFLEVLYKFDGKLFPNILMKILMGKLDMLCDWLFHCNV